jgi:predicted PurR-regulated permease PerM
MQLTERVEKFLPLAVGALIAVGCFFVLKPFLSAILWAIILCFSTWPVYAWVLRIVRRPAVAALIMTFAAAALLLLPFAVVAPSLARDILSVADSVNQLLAQGRPAPPEWIRDLPLIGGALYNYWIAAQRDSTALLNDLRPYINQLVNGLLRAGAGLGRGLAEVAFSLLIAFFVYRDGHELGRRLWRTTERVAGPRAHSIFEIAGGTTRAFIYGVILSGMAQSILATLGFLVAGVPGALFLGLLTFFLSFVAMGPPLIWFPAGVSLILDDKIWAGGGLLLYGVSVISLIDNFLRPYIMSREGKLPFLLTFLGVLGGLLTFGLIGVFLGPALLGVGFNLAREWTQPE